MGDPVVIKIGDCGGEYGTKIQTVEYIHVEKQRVIFPKLIPKCPLLKLKITGSMGHSSLFFRNKVDHVIT